MAKRMLVIDDESMIREAVAAYFIKQGFEVQSAGNAADGLRLFEEGNVDCVILDLMLPDLSGEEICRRIRATSDVPVVMLTAKNQERDLLNGFSLGADDYVVKPFGLRELHARVTAVLRRWDGWERQDELIRVGNLAIDEAAHAVTRDGQPVKLTQAEWNILMALVKERNRVFTRENLIEAAFGMAYDGYDRAIDSHIKNLRKKIEDDPRNPALILTVYGLGYKLGGQGK